MSKIKKPPQGEVSNIEPNWGNALTNSIGNFLRGSSVLDTMGSSYNAIGQYKKMQSDYQINTCFQQRRKALISCDLVVEPGNDDRQSKKAAKALEENIRRLDFDRITEMMLNSIYFGWSIAEVMWGVRDGLYVIDDLKVRDPDRFRFDHKGGIYLSMIFNKDTPLPEKKFWHVVSGAMTSDNPYGVGLAQSLYWPHLFKVKGLAFWMSFLERFGSPSGVLKMPARDMSDTQKIEQAKSALKDLAQEGSIVLPTDTEIMLVQAAGNSVTDYNTLRIAMDDAISKIIVGQTMTTDNGSSYSQSKTHKSVRDEILEADSDLLSESFNKTIGKWFTEFNFPNATPPRVYRITEQKDDALKTAEKDTKIYAMGYKPTQEYITEVYGEGWVERDIEDAGVDRHNLADKPDQEDPSFSEKPSFTKKRKDRHESMNSIEAAAESFADDYEGILGDRVKELLNIAKTAGDFKLFEQRLAEMAAQDPPKGVLRKVLNSRFVSRLMGAYQGMGG